MPARFIDRFQQTAMDFHGNCYLDAFYVNAQSPCGCIVRRGGGGRSTLESRSFLLACNYTLMFIRLKHKTLLSPTQTPPDSEAHCYKCGAMLFIGLYVGLGTPIYINCLKNALSFRLVRRGRMNRKSRPSAAGYSGLRPTSLTLQSSSVKQRLNWRALEQ